MVKTIKSDINANLSYVTSQDARVTVIPRYPGNCFLPPTPMPESVVGTGQLTLGIPRIGIRRHSGPTLRGAPGIHSAPSPGDAEARPAGGVMLCAVYGSPGPKVANPWPAHRPPPFSLRPPPFFSSLHTVSLSSHHGSVATNLTSMSTQVRSLALLSQLRIQHFFELWCRFQMWIGSGSCCGCGIGHWLQLRFDP